MVVVTLLRTGAYLYRTQPNIQRFYSRGDNHALEFLSQFWCNMILFVPLAIAASLFVVVYICFGVFLTVFSLWFGTQELVLHTSVPAECGGRATGDWLFAFGCLGVVQLAITHCTRSGEESGWWFCVELLVGLGQLLWLVHGYFVLQSLPSAKCQVGDWLFSWFAFTVQFELFGGIALLAVSAVLLALASRVLVAILHLDRIESQPLV
ncbi:hypothetical protein BASA81_007332 [Batrachochytrium salamandrivorans]|nr:hypothetical protein BASA81_007332 [Batrachochytrium salamandrivorans]